MIKRFLKDKVYNTIIAPTVFFILEYLVKKNKETITIAIPRSRVYADNSRYFFEYCVQNTDLNVFLLTKNKDLFTELDSRFPGKILYAYSKKGLRTFLKSGIVFMSHNKFDFHPYYPIGSRKEFINLWHGSPLKRVDYTRFKGSDEHTNLSKFCKKAIVSSEFTKYLFATVWKMHIDDLWMTGQPRNDVLEIENKELEDQFPILKKKIILYAPTFREWEDVKFFPFDDLDLLDLHNYLEREDAYILIRCHLNDWENLDSEILKKTGKSERLIFASVDMFPCIHQLLPFSDVLITDYSSIYFDFLILNRPIIFLPYDLDLYNKKRGFTVDYNRNTPGPKLKDYAAFKAHLEAYFNNPELDQEERIKIRDKYNAFLDGNASKRIVDIIEKEYNLKPH